MLADLTPATPEGKVEKGHGEISSTAAMTIPPRYLDRALVGRRIETMEDGKFFAEIPGFDGVWGAGETKHEAIDDLRAALVGWLLLKMEDCDGDIPVIDDMNLNAQAQGYIDQTTRAGP